MTVKELLEQLQKAIADDPDVENYDLVYTDYEGYENYIHGVKAEKYFKEFVFR